MVETAHRERILRAAPQFRCGDELLTRVYRERWASFAANVMHTDDGYLVTEFHQPGPGRAYGTVNAAAGHHILEGRWLADPDIIGDYVRFWFTSGEAEPHRYTEWIAWAAGEYARTQNAWDSVASLLPGMVANFEAWAADSLHDSGLYWAHDLADAMEFSISGDGFRPTINSYQFANAAAIAELARRSGDHDLARRFESERDALRRLTLDHLYDDDLGIFSTIPLSPDGEDAYTATAGAERRMPAEYRHAPLPTRANMSSARRVRELIGFVPWYVGLPGDEIDPRPAVAELTDPEGFGAPFGLRTAERRHPRYAFDVRSTLPRFLCRWNGPSWPFATSQTLSALARIARGPHGATAASVYLDLLRQFAAAHIQPDGDYWLDEDLDPDTGSWIARDWRRQHDVAKAQIGRDYQHSTFADLVLSGLLGIDVAADGRSVTVAPLQAAAPLEWFEVTGLRLAGADVGIVWSHGAGLRVTTPAGVAEAPGLGPVTAPLSPGDRD
ncbi:MAG: MGH1-like glycoside hydrolase domain-containing protein [Protaetiibacter sp.]